MYQIIELKLPQQTFASSMNQLFGLNLSRAIVGQVKTKAALSYRPTYDAKLKKLATGRLLHADETKINIAGGSGYVWVFTNLEEVAFYYTESREVEVPWSNNNAEHAIKSFAFAPQRYQGLKLGQRYARILNSSEHL